MTSSLGPIHVTRKLFHEETQLARLDQRMEALAVSVQVHSTSKRAFKPDRESKPAHDPKYDLICLM